MGLLDVLKTSIKSVGLTNNPITNANLSLGRNLYDNYIQNKQQKATLTKANAPGGFGGTIGVSNAPSSGTLNIPGQTIMYKSAGAPIPTPQSTALNKMKVPAALSKPLSPSSSDTTSQNNFSAPASQTPTLENMKMNNLQSLVYPTGNNQATQLQQPQQSMDSAYLDALKQYQTEYANKANEQAQYLAPSEQEKQLQAQIDALTAQQGNLSASEALGLANIKSQPIAMNYQTGQSAALQNQAAAQQQALGAQQTPLINLLARAQANRGIQSNIVQNQAEIAKNNLANFQSLYAPKEIAAGTSLVQRNPTTGAYEQIASGGLKPTDDISNYNFAKQQNPGIGSFTDWKRQQAALSTGAYDIQTDPNTGAVYRINKLTGVTEPMPGIGGSGQLNIGVKQSDAQLQAAGYANRAQTSAQIVDQLGNVGSELKGIVSGSSLFPNALKSPERQQLEQAQRDFVNAVLRKESGAVIAQNEFDNAAKQYFPQPGDSAAVIQQKKDNRNLKIQSLIQEAQTAYQGNQSGTGNSVFSW